MSLNVEAIEAELGTISGNILTRVQKTIPGWIILRTYLYRSVPVGSAEGI